MLINMKRKNPKCVKGGKVMKVIYTKETYKMDNKYKTFWSKKGYICNHIYYPMIIIDYHKKYGITNYLIDSMDIDLRLLLNAIYKIFKIYRK